MTDRPPTLPDAILRQLREDLIGGRYAPGDRIPLDAVAAAAGVSAVPVREALRVLQSEGRVQHEPHRGYRVTHLSMADVEEIFLICRLLEAEAVPRGVRELDAAGLERMRAALEQLESPPPDASPWDQVAVHQEFHFVPVQYAGLPRLEAELRRLWDHTDHYRSLYVFGDRAAMVRMNRDHRAILAACEAGDAELVAARLDAHRDRALAHVVAHMGAPA